MSAKQHVAIKMRAPARELKTQFEPSLFLAKDITALAEAIHTKLASDIQPARLALDLTFAFAYAHHAEIQASLKTPIGNLDARLSAAAKAGRDFLLSIGIDDEPTALGTASRGDILQMSPLLYELLQYAPTVEAEKSLLSGPTITGTLSTYRMNSTERRKWAAEGAIIDAARSVAFLVAVAEAKRAALPRRRPRGPMKSSFGPTLLRALARCYQENFGEWPSVPRVDAGNLDGDLIRSGSALKWIRAVINTALQRLESGEVEHVGVSTSLLLREISSLEKNSHETLGRKIEEAIAQVRPPKNHWLHDVMRANEQ
jgi:hypothetical protein